MKTVFISIMIVLPMLALSQTNSWFYDVLGSRKTDSCACGKEAELELVFRIPEAAFKYDLVYIELTSDHGPVAFRSWDKKTFNNLYADKSDKTLKTKLIKSEKLASKTNTKDRSEFTTGLIFNPSHTFGALYGSTFCSDYYSKSHKFSARMMGTNIVGYTEQYNEVSKTITKNPNYGEAVVLLQSDSELNVVLDKKSKKTNNINKRAAKIAVITLGSIAVGWFVYSNLIK